MTKTHEAILKTLAGFQRTFGKDYCRPPQKVILRRLKELNEWGYLFRIVRHIRGKGIKMVCRATAYYLMEKTRKYFLWLKRAAERLVVCFRAAKFGSRFVFKEEHNFKVASSDVEILLKSALKGRASPIGGVL